MLYKLLVASTFVCILVIFATSVILYMNQYVFALSKPSDSGRHFVLLRFCDFPVNQFNFNFLHCLGLIDLFSLYVLLPHFRPRDGTLENHCFQIPKYLRASE